MFRTDQEAMLGEDAKKKKFTCLHGNTTMQLMLSSDTYPMHAMQCNQRCRWKRMRAIWLSGVCGPVRGKCSEILNSTCGFIRMMFILALN